MSSSRLRVHFRPKNGHVRTAVLRGVDAQVQLTIPEALRDSLGGAATWAGRSFDLAELRAALEKMMDVDPERFREDPVTWDATDADRLDLDISLAILILARDLHTLGHEGAIDVGGT